MSAAGPQQGEHPVNVVAGNKRLTGRIAAENNGDLSAVVLDMVRQLRA